MPIRYSKRNAVRQVLGELSIAAPSTPCPATGHVLPSDFGLREPIRSRPWSWIFQPASRSRPRLLPHGMAQIYRCLLLLLPSEHSVGVSAQPLFNTRRRITLLQ